MSDELLRRDFLRASSLGFGALLGGPELPAPPSPGRAHLDAAGRRRILYGLLGDLPDRERPIGTRKRKEEERDGYVLETWDLDLNGIESVPAFLARPRSPAGRAPAVLFNHSHGGGYKVGKLELVNGREYLQGPPYAKVLTDLG